jgi:hypothetical protein
LDGAVCFLDGLLFDMMFPIGHLPTAKSSRAWYKDQPTIAQPTLVNFPSAT